MLSTTSEWLELPDVNVLLALLDPEHLHHHAAEDWFRETPGFASTPVTESGFVRLSLNRKITGRQLTVSDALHSLTALQADPRSHFLPDDSRLTEARIGLDGLIGHRQVTDMHLVNLAAANGAVLVTFDRRIARSLLPHDAAHVRTL